MKIGRLFPDLLATLGGAASSEAGFARTLRRLVTLSGARAGGLRFRPGDGAPVDVIVGARRGSPLEVPVASSPRFISPRIRMRPMASTSKTAVALT